MTDKLLNLLTRLQVSATPIDMENGDDDARIPAAMWREFVDAHADLLGGRYVPEGKAEWLIWSNEHRAWWGPARCGYPRTPQNAGRYTLAEARDICLSRHWLGGTVPPETMIHIEEVAQYVNMNNGGISPELTRGEPK